MEIIKCPITGQLERLNRETGEWLPYDEELEKGTKPYFLGPRGGKYEDAALTKPYQEDKPKKIKKKKEVYEPPTERYSDEEAIRKLMSFGGGLYEHQRRDKSRNAIGLNSNDMMYWERTVGDLWAMRRMLKKYHKQISKDEYYKLGLADPIPVSLMAPRYLPNGKLLLPIDGRISNDDFNKFRDINKKHGVNYNWSSRTNEVRSEDLDEFDFEEYRKDMGTLGIMVKDPIGERVKPKPKQALNDSKIFEQNSNLNLASMTTKEIIQGIKSYQVNDTIVVYHDKKDGMFKFYSNYDEKIRELFSNVGGQLSMITEWDGNDKARLTNSLELAEEALDKLKVRFPDWSIVTDGLKEARIKRDQELAELQKPIPEVQEKIDSKFKLFEYQNECVRFLDQTDGNALIGDEMGLGKTLQTLAWAAKNDKKVLVVCPKVVRRTWVQEAHKFFPDHFRGQELVAADLRKKNKKIDLSNTNIVTVNYESLSKFEDMIKEAGFDAIIVDESHRMKNPKAKQTQNIFKIGKDLKHKILLSGTAVKNKREDLRTQLEMVTSKQEASRILTGYHGQVWHKMAAVYLARVKQHVLKDLPDKTTTIMEQEVPGLPDFDGTIKIGDISRLKDQVAQGKVPATKEVVNEILKSSEDRVIVFTESVAAAKKLAAEFGDDALLHYGTMSDNAREAVKEEWQRTNEYGEFITPKKVFVTTKQSMAVGATMTAANRVVFNDLPWTAADLRQAEDRAHRIGQKKAVNVYWVTAIGNDFDQNVTEIIKRKYELSAKINSGRQLTPAEREWMNKPLSATELFNQIRGVPSGPNELESTEDLAARDAGTVEVPPTIHEPEVSAPPPIPKPTKPKREPVKRVTKPKRDKPVEVKREPVKPIETKPKPATTGPQLDLFGASKAKPEETDWAALAKLKQGPITNVSMLPADLRLHLTENSGDVPASWPAAVIPGIAVKVTHKGKPVIITATRGPQGKPIYRLWSQGKYVEAPASAVDKGWDLDKDTRLKALRVRPSQTRKSFVIQERHALSRMW
jgi:SNF2 family DNA or RNA helicase